MLYETLRGVEPLRKLYHTAIYRNACDVIHAPAAETVLRLLLLAAFAALFYLLCRQTQNRFRSVWITAVVCVLSAAALFLPLFLRDAAGYAFVIPLPLCTSAASAVLLVFYFFTMIAKPDSRHQRSILLTLLALLAGNAARLYFYTYNLMKMLKTFSSGIRFYEYRPELRSGKYAVQYLFPANPKGFAGRGIRRG